MGNAYLIANVRFKSREKAQEYGMQVAPLIAKYGGRYLARGGQVRVLEGEWQPGYLSVVEFPSLDPARQWYESDEYAAIKALRHENADSEIVFTEGI